MDREHDYHSRIFLVEDFEINPIKEDIKWARSRWALNKEAATGSEITFTLRGDKELKDVIVKLHVSVYDKIPVIRKRFEVINRSDLPINIDTFQLEYLALPNLSLPEEVTRPSSSCPISI